METMNKAVNAVKDGYLWVVQWVDDHPHKVVWLWPASLILALVLG